MWTGVLYQFFKNGDLFTLLFIVSTSGLEVLCGFGAVNAKGKRILVEVFMEIL